MGNEEEGSEMLHGGKERVSRKETGKDILNTLVTRIAIILKTNIILIASFIIFHYYHHCIISIVIISYNRNFLLPLPSFLIYVVVVL